MVFADKNACLGAADLPRLVAGIEHGLIGKLQHDSLIRLHGQGFFWRDAKHVWIKEADFIQIARFFEAFVRKAPVGKQRLSIFLAMDRKVVEAFSAKANVFPKLLYRIRLGKASGDADNRDVIAFCFACFLQARDVCRRFLGR